MLTEHPEITQRLRNEILAKVGPTNRPTSEDMRDMRYLKAFVNGMKIFTVRGMNVDLAMLEVLRLYPPVYVEEYCLVSC